MKLTKFQIQNFKKIEDTGVVNVGDLACFVGKNEAGKSAILQALAKLNPTSGDKYDSLREFPHSRFSDEFTTRKTWPVATGWFELTKDERSGITDLAPALEKVKVASVTRHYDDSVKIAFEPTPNSIILQKTTFLRTLKSLADTFGDMVAPDGKGEEFRPLKEAVMQAITQAITATKANAGITIPAAIPEQLATSVQQQITETWHKEVLDATLATIKEDVATARSAESIKQAEAWVKERLPKFLYFDKYDVLTSSVHLPTFKQHVDSNDRSARVGSCLFRHVGLDITQMVSLGANVKNGNDDASARNQVDERSIRANSAAQGMTKKFRNWWQQRTHTFEYQFDGDYFRVWVSDDLDPSRVELEQRSSGLQYFFSFYLVFLVEQEEAHHGCILLLDEPGHHLHGTAQLKLIDFFKTISQNNQTLYTTHSPFMVPANDLHLVRTVYEAPDTGRTVVSEDVWPRDKDCLFPLQAALGYELAQGLFLGPKQVIVEGITDYWVLKALDQQMSALGKAHLESDIIITPAAGAQSVVHLAGMLIGHRVEVVALLDGDSEGKKAAGKLERQILCDSPSRVLNYAEFTSSGQSDLEDLFPADWLLDAAKVGYPEQSWKFTKDEGAIDSAWKRICTHINNNGVKLEKWRIIGPLRDRLLDSDPQKIPPELVKSAESLFSKINAVISNGGVTQ